MTRLTRRTILAAVPSAIALGAMPAFAQKKYDTGASDSEIKIGHTNPYSGPASVYGVIGKTETAFFNMINEQGGVNGRKINFISYDDGYSPPKTVEQVRKLVESDGVLLLFNTLGTPTNTAIHKYCNAKKGAAAVRRDRRHQMGRSEAFPVDDGLAAELSERRAHLCDLPEGASPERKDRHSVSERRLREGLRQGVEGRARRQGESDDRFGAAVRNKRPDRRFADRQPEGFRRRCVL